MTRPGAFAMLALLSAGLCLAAADEPLADARRFEQAVQQAIAKAEPAIACLLVYRGSTPADRRTDPERNGTDSDSKVPDYFGSGVLISPQGLVLTNYHVVRDARIQIRLPGLTDRDGADAQLIAGDNFSDLAVLKIQTHTNSPLRGMPAISLGNGEKLRKGSFVIAMGHPYAVGFRDGSPSASWGMVSNLRRRLPGSPNEAVRKESLSHYGTLIQTDARLQLGQSGGALVDLDGQLVGLTTAHTALTGYEGSGGFAMPIDAAVRRVIEVLMRGDEVEYGFLGVQADPTVFGRGGEGVAIHKTVGNSPASRAGLQPGDVIVAVNGQPVRDQDDMKLHLECGLAGRKTLLTVSRRGAVNGGDREQRTVEVALAKAAPKPGFAINRPKPVYGLRVDYASIRSDDPIPQGVIVREFQEATAGKQPRLGENDFITHVNGKAVNTPAEFYREAEPIARTQGALRLTVSNPTRTVTLP
jgi:S1-C subfamily serine protease